MNIQVTSNHRFKKNNNVSNHHINIQALLIEIIKTKNGLAAQIMGSKFKRTNTACNIRKFQEFETQRKRSVHFVLETLDYRSPQLRSLLPEHMRHINSLDQFEKM